MGTIGAILGTIIFGAVIGALARLVLPGRQNISMVMTIVLGIIGAMVGYWVYPSNTSGIDWIRWIISIAVAAALVAGYTMIMGRRGIDRTRV